jgi:hypothetical protein
MRPIKLSEPLRNSFVYLHVADLTGHELLHFYLPR